METLLHFIDSYLDALLLMTAEMAPYLLLGFFIAGLLRTFVPRTLYSRHLAPRTMGSVVKAAAIGIPLPLCSCGVIPTAVSLRKEGASHGACVSFLIATPQTGVDSIVATYSLMGLPFAIVRPIAALFTAIFGGWFINMADDAECPCSHGYGDTCPCGHDHCHDSGAGGASSFAGKLRGALEYGFVEMLQDVGKWLVVGLLIAALITVAVPDEWLAALHDYKLLNMLIVLAVAIPMYVCATGSIPIAVSLMAKGLTPGAALVLLMAGPAVNSASMLVIGKVFGRRTLTLYVTAIVIGAMLFGLAIDYLLPQQWFAVSSVITGDMSCAHCLTTTDWVWMSLLVLLLANAFRLMRHHSHHHHGRHAHDAHHHERGHGCRCHDDADANATCHGSQGEAMAATATRYAIEGMSCNHCRANVERAILSVEGVESVEVDLSRSEATVTGAHDPRALMERVHSFGYEARLRLK